MRVARKRARDGAAMRILHVVSGEVSAAKVRDTARAVRAGGRGSSTELLDGEPWTAIEKLTKESGSDLLVAGTHHHAGLQRLMLGSVAEKILRAVDCPVPVGPSRA